MKKNILHLGIMTMVIMIGLLFGVVGKMSAYDFSVWCETGQMLYFNITNAEHHYVELTSPNSYGWYNSTKPTGDLTIPSIVTHWSVSYTVTSIGNNALRDCSNLTSVTIPNTVTSIGNYAFYNCNGLTGSLTIPNAVTFIGNYAFYNCNGLTGPLTIPNAVTSIGDNAFDNCNSLTGPLTISNAVTSIGVCAFYNCNSLTGSLIIPNTVTTIGNRAFWGCSGFSGSLIIPNSVTTIGDSAFSGCNGFTGSLTIPNSVTTIGESAFSGCSGFTENLSIPNSITMIKYGTFSGCSGLTGSLSIPSLVTYIGENAFYNCNNLTSNSLSIPEGVTYIGDFAFYGCSGLSGTLTIPSSVETVGRYMFKGCYFTEVHYNAVSAEYDNSAGWGNFPPYDFDDCSGALVIGNSVESIPPQLFSSCGFTNITIGTSVTTIGRGAFAGCSNAIEVHFNPTNCIHCGYEELAFSGCTGSLIIGDNVTQIPNDAFFSANFNGTLTIGNSVTRIGDAAFNSCGGFTGSLVIPNSVTEIGAWAFTSAGFDGELVIPNTITIIDAGVFGGCGFTGELVIPNSVTLIEISAFSGCSGFTGNLNLPNSITRIAQDCFSWCTGFTGCLEIPSSVTQIESNAFYGCSGLSCISIPNTVQSIGGYVFNETGWYNTQPDGILYLDDWCLGYKGSQPTGNLNIQEGTKGIAGWAFDHCANVTGVLTIPESIEIIGEFAFVGCSGLTELDYNASSLDFGFMDSPFVECYGLNTLVIGNNVEIIPWGIFKELNFTGNLIIPFSVISIGEEAFYNCSGLTGDLTISNSVTSIGSYAFYNCSGFTSLSIGNSVASIGYWAFSGCSSISTMTVFATTPPTLGNGYYPSSVFSNVNKSIPVYIPYGTIEAYMSAPGWNEFTNYHEMTYKTISGYVESDGLWQFIASPLVDIISPETVDNMMSGTDYDLYQFNPTEAEGPWQNFKADNFVLVNGQGYLYASEEEVNIIFKGEFNEDETKVVELVYDEGQPNAGWNLVGNPFPCTAYINREYYVMNDDGTAINPVAMSASTPIPPCTGVMVKAEGEGETVVFTRAVGTRN